MHLNTKLLFSGVNISKLLASSKKKLGPLLKKQIFVFFYPLLSINSSSF